MPEGFTLQTMPLTAEELLGANIYDISGDSIGEVHDLVFAAPDAGTARAIDILLDHAETLEKGESSPIKDLQSLAMPPDHARYSFLLEDPHPQSAREDLAEAVAMLVERPALDAALAAATARFDADPEGAIAEQQRLRERKLALEERLRQLARQRVSAPAQEESSPAVVHPAQDEQGMD